MDLALNEVQTMLQNSAREFMEAEMPKSRVLEIDDSPSGFAVDLWEKMCGIGWAGMAVPEEFGGSGNSFTDLGVVYEMMGYYACSSPHLSSAVLCSQVILEAGNQEQKQSLLPPIASGQQIFSLALTEPEYGWGADTVHLQATRHNGSFTLEGDKLFIPDANVADRLRVVARTAGGPDPEHGLSIFIVDKDAPGGLGAGSDGLDRPQGLRSQLRQCVSVRIQCLGSGGQRLAGHRQIVGPGHRITLRLHGRRDPKGLRDGPGLQPNPNRFRRAHRHIPTGAGPRHRHIE